MLIRLLKHVNYEVKEVTGAIAVPNVGDMLSDDQVTELINHSITIEIYDKESRIEARLVIGPK